MSRSPTEEEIDRWVQLYTEEGLSSNQISDGCDWSKPTVIKYLNERDVDTSVPDKTVEERFWEKVDIGGNDECWEWQASLNESGYGQFYVNQRHGYMKRAHRISYKLYHNRDLPDNGILHKCHNPKCVNPQHLKVGDQHENGVDAAMSGRHHYARLTPEQVKEIRIRYDGGEPLEEIAKDYPVKKSGVKKAVYGITWERVGGPIGNQNRSQKLSDEEVSEIRWRYENEDVTQYDLADEYGVTQPNIEAIVNYKTRKEVA